MKFWLVVLVGVVLLTVLFGADNAFFAFDGAVN